MLNNVVKFLEVALECSIFVNPRNPGLTDPELREVGTRAGFRPGEINDALHQVGLRYFGQSTVQPNISHASWLLIFNPPESPDYRNIHAFDFVVSELADLEKELGRNQAKLSRDVMVERAISRKNIKETDIEAAITCLIMGGTVLDEKGVISFKSKNSGGERQLFTRQLQSINHTVRITKPDREKAMPFVSEVIAKRTDGSAQSAEAVPSFAEQLTKIGYGQFRLWWQHTASELRLSDPSISPVVTSVLSAALVEGALTFAAKYARDRNLMSFKSNDFNGDAKSWKLEKLLESAASCGVVDQPTKLRAEMLIGFRQRIHAGRMLSEFPTGVPGVLPEQGRDAKGTADLVIRSVSEWLDRQIQGAGSKP